MRSSVSKDSNRAVSWYSPLGMGRNSRASTSKAEQVGPNKSLRLRLYSRSSSLPWALKNFSQPPAVRVAVICPLVMEASFSPTVTWALWDTAWVRAQSRWGMGATLLARTRRLFSPQGSTRRVSESYW